MRKEYFQRFMRPSSLSVSVQDELVRQAYRQQPGSLVIALTVALALSAMLQDDTQGIWLWFFAMVAVCIVRIGVHRSFLQTGSSQPGNAGLQRWRALFVAGQTMSGVLWAVLPLMWLGHVSTESRYIMLIVLSALGAGATSVLAPDKWGGRVFIALTFLPSAAMLFVGADAHVLLGILGFVFFWVMIFSHRLNHILLVRNLMLAIERAELVERLTQRAHEIETLNASLEHKVVERTRALRAMAETDSLTGLLNRRGLTRRLEARMRGDSSVAVILFDLVRFKQINSRLGYSAGDEVLREIARRVRSQLQPGTDFARWGGDEFIVTCDDGSHGARQAWQMVRKALQPELIAHGEPHRITARAGIAIEGMHGRSAGALLNAADLALTELKRQGRGSLLFYRDSLAPEQRRRLDLAFEIQSADARNELYLIYQPIVSARDGCVESLEALLRWRHPRFGMVPPDEFIPIVEESASINRLGEWVLLQACRTASEWRIDGRDGPRVAVNVSVLQLRDPYFAERVADILSETGLSSARLDVEVTESVFDASNAERISLTLSRLSSMGLRIHIDDFGTGYSSLSRLHALPIDCIKIDRSFVARLDTGSAAIIEGAILIARRFGLQTVAEGVETLSQARALHRLGVDFFQGYFVQKPMEQARLQPIAADWL